MNTPPFSGLVDDLFARRGREPVAATRRRRARPLAGRIERLEDRRVMAFDLAAAYATTADRPFFVAGGVADTLTDAPQQITLRFSPGVKIDPATLENISIVRSGGAGDGFGTAGSKGDVTIVPGSVTVNDLPSDNEVVIRFAETPLDDTYRITVGGGTNGLKTRGGDTLAAASRTIDVRLDLGAFVVSVVPQPVSRSGSSLTQDRDQIAVYFNADDPLSATSAQTAASYRLFEIDKATGADKPDAFGAGQRFANPTTVSYTASTGKTLLTFAAGAVAADKLYRLQIGAAETLVAPPAAKVEGADFTDANSSFSTAYDLGALTAGGASVTAAIDVVTGVVTPAGSLRFPTQPGSIDEPGHRDLPDEIGNDHGFANRAFALDNAIAVEAYNFRPDYGSDPQGNPLVNTITETQKQRAREIFELYSRSTGVRFVETAASGITVVTGDMRAIDPNINTAPAGLTGLVAATGNRTAIMDSTENWGASEYGGAWFRVAMHEIGHALGLSHSYDLNSIMGSALAGEPVFPGDYDTIHLAQLYPAGGSDLDVYRFSLATAGRLSAETFVGRPGQPATSKLDSLLTLYKDEPSTGQRTLVARNDDYYGRDSFLGLDLTAGTYFVAVSSTGNDAFNPDIGDSGAGGRSDGAYRLKLGFQPASTAATTIADVSGTLLDGDRDGKPGGAFDFWFNTAGSTTDPATNKTLFVDKASTVAGNGDGTLANPFKRVDLALAAAAPGSIVRIAGNAADDPYLIGTTLGGQPLPDGATFNVPKGVTVMIDEGAVFKLRAAAIDVGSSSGLVDRSGASIQVLGTPGRNVVFSSYHDDTVGTPVTSPTRPGSDDGVGPAATGGQWGGIVLRSDSDSPTKKAFVNSVSQARIKFGGGQVFVDSKLESFAPLQLENTRPTLAFNTITGSAGAAISATPNSFEDADGRVGPEIRGNRLSGNTTNGLFVKIRTPLGGEPERLDVAARFRGTDIVYVLQDNLFIAGGAGGYERIGANDFARRSGRLAIDPGVVVKLQGARIELERGTAQLIAEGTAGQRVIFTSLGDNRFGAGGTFDTNGNLPDRRAAGDWGGIVLDAGSKAGIDHAYVAYGGGQTPIEGTVDSFNVIEVHQGDLRLAHSRIENNAAGKSATDRTARGSNTAATVFARGARPVILGNDFRDNLGAVVSVNVNSLDDSERPDSGRSSGFIDRDPRFDDNRGPLVRDNRLSYTIDAAADRPAGGAIAGMVVRGGEITVESAWDDADIVHVLQDEIWVHNFHTATGVRLLSRPDASLVVKLAGAEAGLTAAGYGLDITDRIGGTVQIVGQPGYPVILTSLADDSAGSSLDPIGQLVKDINTDASASAPAAGDWRSLKFLPLSNDRNVAIVPETEKAAAGWLESNSTPATAQVLGILAPNVATGMNTTESAQEKSGDDARRLGFEVHGAVAWTSPRDVDVYSFTGYAGSEVWIDIDKTSPGLDALVELLDAGGAVRARSADVNDAALAAGTTLGGLPLAKDAWRGGDYHTVNPRDPGMRVILPGIAGTQNQYFLRVRSQPRFEPVTVNNGTAVTATTQAAYEAALAADPATTPSGATSGAYELRVRLQQRDEKPGSTVRYADIRYPKIGIDVQGLPRNSPLTGETGESAAGNETLATAQPVGNLLQSDHNTIGIAGRISTATDVDWYTFTLNYEQIQNIGGVNSGAKSWSAVFDLDYGDQVQGDFSLFVFDATGTLIYTGRDSDVAADQPGAGQGSDLDDLSRGSLGKLDPFIGSVQMPAGSATGSGAVSPAGAVAVNEPAQTRYYVAVASNRTLPTALDATFKDAATNALIRLEPISSVRRIVEDHIGFDGYTTESGLRRVVGSRTGAIIDVSNSIRLAAHVTPFTLADVTLFVSTANSLRTIDALRGIGETTIQANYGPGQTIGDLVMRSDGRLYSYSGLPNTPNTAGRLDFIDTGTGARTAVGNDGIPNPADPPNAGDPQPINTDQVDAVAWQRTGVGAYANLFYSVREAGRSRLYRANPADGSAVAPTPNPNGFGFRGVIQDRANRLGVVGGMASVGGTLYGVDTNGFLFTIDTGSGAATIVNQPAGNGVSYAGLALGPQNLDGGRLKNALFAIDTSGSLHAFTTSGVPLTEFDSDNDGVADATSIRTSASGATGLAFSPLDVNLWHPTTRRGADAGHGVNAAPDFTRKTTTSRTVTDGRGIGRSSAEAKGGVSMYFGFERYVDSAQTPFLNYESPRTQYGVFDPVWQQDLSTNAAIPDSYNLPGGAYGSLTTNAFSLSDYAYTSKPTLYFNYWLQTEGASGNIDTMRDSARVFVSADGGAWEVIATNNSVKSAVDTSDAELPAFASVSSRASDPVIDNQHVQELFDSAGWRQARIDLGRYAGRANIRLRFDFSTAGEFDPNQRNAAGVLLNDIRGLAGTTGSFTSPERGQNNQFEGFYIDDIIVGFAERGEMVTGAVAGQTSFFDLATIGTPTAGTPTVSAQSLAGNYQLEIRRGTTYGAALESLEGDVFMFNQFDTDADLVPGNPAQMPVPALGHPSAAGWLGDANTPRPQGQFLIQNNVIAFAATYGISIDAGSRDAISKAPLPGVPQNLTVPNAGRLVPGVVVANNVVSTSGTAGIRFSGDPDTGGLPPAAVPYGRIVNNTIYGGTTPAGTGVEVSENAGPTLINNLFANLDTGVRVDASSRVDAAGNQRTVITTAAFHAVGTQVAGGAVQSRQLVLPASPFVNAARGNFYPTAGSPVIDSALDALADRAEYVVVNVPLGVPQSPVIAPDRDLFGQLRGDDPAQASAPGLGSNVFKDRGAIDRVDFAKPFLGLVAPLDGSAIDNAVHPDVVLLKGNDSRGVTQFVLQLNDLGAGIDKATVVKQAFALSRNGAALAEGSDYVFRYLETTNQIIFESAAVFTTGNYEIRVNQAAGVNMIADLAGNPLLPNKTDGTTSFSITLAQAPGIPSGVTGTAGDRQVSLTWIAPSDIGTSAITDYVIQFSTDGGTTWTPFPHAASAAASIVVTGLTNGTAYVFRVAAVNDVGQGPFSSPSAAVTPAALPPRALPAAPTAVAALAANRAAFVLWTAPSDTGGVPVTGYVVRYTGGGGAQTVNVGTDSPTRIEGLVNGTSYTFAVAAVTAAGTGPFSAPSNAVTPGPQPLAPSRLAGTVGNGSVSLRWTAPRTRGVSDYVIQYSGDGGATWDIFLDAVSATTRATVTGLDNGTTYVFRVAAIANGVIGDFSAQSARLTPFDRAARPAAPANLRGVSSGGGIYALQWDAVAGNGGGEVRDYVIQYRVNSGANARWVTFRDSVSASTSAALRRLTSRSGYVFRVAAKNLAGVGAYSAEVVVAAGTG